MHNSEAADPQKKVPKKRPTLWALDARSTGDECP